MREVGNVSRCPVNFVLLWKQGRIDTGEQAHSAISKYYIEKLCLHLRQMFIKTLLSKHVLNTIQLFSLPIIMYWPMDR